GRLNVQIQGQADLAVGQYVSETFFSTLGVPPAAGRLIGSGDDRAGAAPVAVISFGYAQRRFGEISKAVGQPVLIDNNPFTIAGVAAPSFWVINPAGPQDVYVPMHAILLLDARDPAESAKFVDPKYHWVDMMGRLRPGVTKEQAQAALAPVF